MSESRDAFAEYWAARAAGDDVLTDLLRRSGAPDRWRGLRGAGELVSSAATRVRQRLAPRTSDWVMTSAEVLSGTPATVFIHWSDGRFVALSGLEAVGGALVRVRWDQPFDGNVLGARLRLAEPGYALWDSETDRWSISSPMTDVEIERALGDGPD